MVIILANDLKTQLSSERIENIFKKIGCHHIRHHNDRITAARPTGDNPSSVCCYIDKDSNGKCNYHTDIYTRGDYQSSFPTRDIISAVQYLCGLSFPKAMKRICEILGFDYYAKEPEKPKLLSFLDQIEGKTVVEESNQINILNEDVLAQFVNLPSTLWKSEGISLKSQSFFEIGFDPESERITIPIRTELGDLCGIKGRAITEDENKYLYIFPAPKMQILFGESQNSEQIKHLNEVIVVESEKSVIKLHSIGFPNSVAIGGKALSEKHCQNLLRMGVPITLALDADVTEDEIKAIVDKLKYPVATLPIYLIRDPLGIYLSEKESPMDNETTWKALYRHKERV